MTTASLCSEALVRQGRGRMLQPGPQNYVSPVMDPPVSLQGLMMPLLDRVK